MASPIETRFLEALPDAIPEGFRLFIYPPGMDPHADHDRAGPVERHGESDKHGTVLLFPQARLGTYRVDFLLLLGAEQGIATSVLAIECDGHEWHERTKQQASYDRAKDRDILARHGVPTIRFTGSDIARDENQCAREAFDVLSSMHGQAHFRIEQAVRAVAKQLDLERDAQGEGTEI